MYALILIDRTAVDNRLGIFISAKNYQKVADHGRFPFFIQLYDLVFAELIQSHLHHTNRTFHDLLTGINNSCSLLALRDFADVVPRAAGRGI